MTNGWLKECWCIIEKYKLKLHSTSLWVPSYLRENDASIMKTLYDLGKFEDWQLKQINRCRMNLQASTISDISTACGTTINQARISRLPTRLEFSGYNWSQQKSPDLKYWELWRAACRALLNTEKVLSTPLDQWLSSPRQFYEWEISSDERKLYRRLQGHAMVHQRKVPHRNSLMLHKEFLLCGCQAQLSEIPSDTKYTEITQGSYKKRGHYSNECMEELPTTK